MINKKNSIMSPYLIIILIFFVIALLIIGRIMIIGQESTDEQVCKASLNKASIRYSELISGGEWKAGNANVDLIQCNAKTITFKEKYILSELVTSNGRYLTDESSASNPNSFLAREINSCFAMAGIEGGYCNDDRGCILKCAHIRNEKEKPITLDRDISDSSLDGYRLYIGTETDGITFSNDIGTETEYILGVESFGKNSAQKRIILLPIQNAFDDYAILN